MQCCVVEQNVKQVTLKFLHCRKSTNTADGDSSLLLSIFTETQQSACVWGYIITKTY